MRNRLAFHKTRHRLDRECPQKQVLRSGACGVSSMRRSRPLSEVLGNKFYVQAERGAIWPQESTKKHRI